MGFIRRFCNAEHTLAYFLYFSYQFWIRNEWGCRLRWNFNGIITYIHSRKLENVKIHKHHQMQDNSNSTSNLSTKFDQTQIQSLFKSQSHSSKSNSIQNISISTHKSRLTFKKCAPNLFFYRLPWRISIIKFSKNLHK